VELLQRIVLALLLAAMLDRGPAGSSPCRDSTMKHCTRLLGPLALAVCAACAGGVGGTGGAATGHARDGSAAEAAAFAPDVLREYPGLPRIREADLRRDLFLLAGDDMRGREAGTLDELRASVWLAEQARAAGLQPAGEDGTWYQWFSLRRPRQSATSTITLGGRTLRLWQDVTPLAMSSTSIDAPIAWLGDTWDPETADVAGRVAAVQLRTGDDAPPLELALAARRYGPRVANAAARPLLQRGAVAVIVVGDAAFDRYYDLVATNAVRGSYALEDGSDPTISTAAPALLVRSTAQPAVSAPGARLEARLTVDRFEYPSVNVVARVPGTDPALRGEVVLFSAHQDHDGVRAPIGGDSIYNGADDNATVAVALLAIGRAFAASPGRRSALFVWHGAEEKGLHGSRFHVEKPLVPRDSIVAVLNGDMIGRNHPDTAALLGSIPPHRNSSDLVALAHEANRRVTGFAIDSTWDRPTHPEGWYFRSDHLPYARARVPALFFTTLLHEDYHTPFDNPDRIDTAKLERMTRWMYATGWLAANSPQRPRIDPGFQLER
jgi:hypothetical protein